MAKKSSKKRARRAPKMYPKGAPTSSSVRARPAVREVAEEPVRQAPSKTSSEDLREEYWYVYNDLKRIALISSTLFAILIGLSFVI